MGMADLQPLDECMELVAILFEGGGAGIGTIGSCYILVPSLDQGQGRVVLLVNSGEFFGVRFKLMNDGPDRLSLLGDLHRFHNPIPFRFCIAADGGLKGAFYSLALHHILKVKTAPTFEKVTGAMLRCHDSDSNRRLMAASMLSWREILHQFHANSSVNCCKSLICPMV